MYARSELPMCVSSQPRMYPMTSLLIRREAEVLRKEEGYGRSQEKDYYNSKGGIGHSVGEGLGLNHAPNLGAEGLHPLVVRQWRFLGQLGP